MSNSRSSIVLRTERPFLVPVSDDDEEDEEDDAFLVPAVLVAGRTCGVDVAREALFGLDDVEDEAEGARGGERVRGGVL